MLQHQRKIQMNQPFFRILLLSVRPFVLLGLVRICMLVVAIVCIRMLML